MVIYETINLINGKRYIGQDLNNNPEYLGSGLLLQRAIKKHGKENFKKTILEHCSSRDELSIREKFWINNSNAVESEQYYNIARGGNGGDCITGLPTEKYKNLMIIKSINMRGEKNHMYGKTHSPEPKKLMSRPGPANGMYGKTHSDNTKQLQKDKSKDRYTLDWFVKRYGTEIGNQKFIDRNKQLSETRSGRLNPAYKHVDENDLKNLLSDSSYTLSAISKYFNVSVPCINNKIKECFAVSTFTEACRKFR